MQPCILPTLYFAYSMLYNNIDHESWIENIPLFLVLLLNKLGACVEKQQTCDAQELSVQVGLHLLK